LLLQGCSLGQTNKITSNEKVESEVFTRESVLEHIQQSYTLGCSKAYQSQKMKNYYETCNRLGQKHAKEVQAMLETKDE